MVSNPLQLVTISHHILRISVTKSAFFLQFDVVDFMFLSVCQHLKLHYCDMRLLVSVEPDLLFGIRRIFMFIFSDAVDVD